MSFLSFSDQFFLSFIILEFFFFNIFSFKPSRGRPLQTSHVSVRTPAEAGARSSHEGGRDKATDNERLEDFALGRLCPPF